MCESGIRKVKVEKDVVKFAAGLRWTNLGLCDNSTLAWILCCVIKLNISPTVLVMYPVVQQYSVHL